MAGFREALPASLQEILQNGLLDHVFEDALVASFLYDTLADIRPWEAQLGSTSIMTRAGLMTPVTAPITGSDATAASYGFEQYQLQMNQYGNSIDTNMATSAFALASKFIEDNKTLAINAAQSLDLVAQSSLYTAYSGGNSWVTGSQASNKVPLADVTGFQFNLQAVSTANSDPTEGNTGVASYAVGNVGSAGAQGFFIDEATGACYTYTGVQYSTPIGAATPGWLTGCQAINPTHGDGIIAVLNLSGTQAYGGNNVVTQTTSPIAPQIIRPSGVQSQYALLSTNVATLNTFRSAVTRLKGQHVPNIGGAYTAHVHPVTVQELFQDSEFQSAYRGRGDSPVYQNNDIGMGGGDATFLGRFAGIDWVENTVTPAVLPTALDADAYAGTVYRPIVVGDGALIKGPFTRMGSLLGEISSGTTVEIQEIGGVVRILRLPLDRLGQVLSSTWSWIGGYTTGSDLMTGDNAIYKRAVIVEHA